MHALNTGTFCPKPTTQQNFFVFRVSPQFARMRRVPKPWISLRFAQNHTAHQIYLSFSIECERTWIQKFLIQRRDKASYSAVKLGGGTLRLNDSSGKSKTQLFEWWNTPNKSGWEKLERLKWIMTQYHEWHYLRPTLTRSSVLKKKPHIWYVVQTRYLSIGIWCTQCDQPWDSY